MTRQSDSGVLRYQTDDSNIFSEVRKHERLFMMLNLPTKKACLP